MLKNPLFLGALFSAALSATSLISSVAEAATSSAPTIANGANASASGNIETADEPPAPPPLSRDPFDHRLSVAGYGLGWAGSYPAAGVGGRIRFEWPHVFGVEGFADHLAVEWAGGFRHDHPIGFDIYKPFQISRAVRLRPMLGACVVFSFIEPTHSGGPSADDILFGVHGGLGMEVALERNWSFFVEGKGIAYLGHDRTSQNWTASVSQGVSTTYVFQPNIGLEIHFL